METKTTIFVSFDEPIVGLLFLFFFASFKCKSNQNNKAAESSGLPIAILFMSGVFISPAKHRGAYELLFMYIHCNKIICVLDHMYIHYYCLY